MRVPPQPRFELRGSGQGQLLAQAERAGPDRRGRDAERGGEEEPEMKEKKTQREIEIERKKERNIITTKTNVSFSFFCLIPPPSLTLFVLDGKRGVELNGVEWVCGGIKRLGGCGFKKKGKETKVMFFFPFWEGVSLKSSCLEV